MTDNFSCNIRPAVTSDCAAIRRLIQELADYEKYPDGPKISEKDLQEDGFGERKFFHCFVAEVKTETAEGCRYDVVGYALYFFIYSTWVGRSVFMEDLYVSEKCRHKGLGIALWKAVAEEGLKNGCSRLDFSVLNWNKPSIAFYESKGAINLTEAQGWNLFRLEKEAMEKLCDK